VQFAPAAVHLICAPVELIVMNAPTPSSKFVLMLQVGSPENPDQVRVHDPEE
jgi:hypothetical protein